MPGKICVIDVKISQEHETTDCVYKNKTCKYGRPIILEYYIGNYDNDNHKIKKEVIRQSLFNTDMLFLSNDILEELKDYDELESQASKDIMEQFENDIKDVEVIISYDLEKQIKALQVECFKNCISITFKNFILIDIRYFNHDFEQSNLGELKNILIKKELDNNLKIIEKCFLKLYKSYKDE